MVDPADSKLAVVTAVGGRVRVGSGTLDCVKECNALGGMEPGVAFPGSMNIAGDALPLPVSFAGALTRGIVGGTSGIVGGILVGSNGWSSSMVCLRTFTWLTCNIAPAPARSGEDVKVLVPEILPLSSIQSLSPTYLVDAPLVMEFSLGTKLLGGKVCAAG